MYQKSEFDEIVEMVKPSKYLMDQTEKLLKNESGFFYLSKLNVNKDQLYFVEDDKHPLKDVYEFPTFTLISYNLVKKRIEKLLSNKNFSKILFDYLEIVNFVGGKISSSKYNVIQNNISTTTITANKLSSLIFRIKDIENDENLKNLYFDFNHKSPSLLSLLCDKRFQQDILSKNVYLDINVHSTFVVMKLLANNNNILNKIYLDYLPKSSNKFYNVLKFNIDAIREYKILDTKYGNVKIINNNPHDHFFTYSMKYRNTDIQKFIHLVQTLVHKQELNFKSIKFCDMYILGLSVTEKQNISKVLTHIIKNNILFNENDKNWSYIIDLFKKRHIDLDVKLQSTDFDKKIINILKLYYNDSPQKILKIGLSSYNLKNLISKFDK